jgi:molybdate transport system substrate-binding protein
MYAMKLLYPLFTTLALAILGALCQPVPVDAAEIKVSTARLVFTVLREVGSQFERETGHRLRVTEIYGPPFKKALAAGAPFDLDVLVLRPDYIDDFISEGKLVAETRTDLVKTGIGVEVRAGAPKPDVSSVEAFKSTLLNAKSIAYLKNGFDTAYLDGMLVQLGIADAIRAKLVQPETDSVSTMTANGEVELGIAITTQILTTPGVELAGPLPPELQRYLVFAGAVSATSTVPEAALALLKFLKGPAAIPVIKAQGMERG